MSKHSKNSAPSQLLRRLIRQTLFTSLGATAVTLVGTIPASAQQPSTALEEVVVTGTRIRGVEAPVGSTVIAIGAEDIPRSGLATASELLRSIPQVTNLGLDDSRTNGAQRAISNLSSGSSINLRGLGVEATLTLVDGRRPVPSGGEGRVFDPNSIPTIALQRVEVVADGSSAIYGSDAMTGVVNLITRREYDGAETRLNYGGADGYDQLQAQQIFGQRFDHGGFMVALEYYNRGNLSTDDRPNLYNDGNALSVLAFPPNLGTTSSPNSGFIDANNDGFLDAGEGTGHPVIGQSNWRGVDALPKQERRSIFAAGDLQIGDNFKLYAQGYYTKRDFTRLATSVTSNGSTVPATNPYNLTGAAVRVFYSYINDFGPQQQKGYEEVWQGVLGGTLRFGDDWEADLSTSYGAVEDWRRRETINSNAVTAALNSTSTATALDPFSNGSNGYPSQQVRDSVLASIHSYDITAPKMNIFDTQLKFDGPLFDMSGGRARLAVGAEHQELERTQTIQSTAAPAPTVNTVNVSVAPKLSRKVDSLFAEMFLPVVGADNAIPAIRELTFALAARYDKYDDTQVAPAIQLLDESTTNPKLGVTWKPIDDLSFHASYGKSFRAPVLGDYSYGAPTLDIPLVVSPQVAAAYGLPAAPVAQSSVIQGGHTLGLTPEKAKTWSFGVDFKPAGLDGLAVSINYYNIKFENQISVPADSGSLQNLSYVQALVNSGSSLVLPGQGLVVFNPTTAQLQAYLAHGGAATAHIGPPDFLLYGAGSAPVGPQNTPVYALVESLSHNGGILKTDGIDFSFRYTWDTAVGTWLVDDTFTYVLGYKQALLPTVPLVDYLNQLNFPLRFQTRAHAGWRQGHWGVDAHLNYQNGYENTSVSPVVDIGSYTTVDARVTYDTGDLGGGNWLSNFSVSLNALNLFDRDPPYARVTQGVAVQNFDSQNASPVGRFVSLQIAKRW